MAEKILVISGKGGVGKSSVSVGLANAMCSMGKSVLLVDADVGFRSLDLIMNIGSQVVYNWLDIIENRCSFSQAVVSGDGMPDLLSAPSDFSESITKESVSELLSRADNDYDYVLVDSAAGADSFTKYWQRFATEPLRSLPVTPFVSEALTRRSERS